MLSNSPTVLDPHEPTLLRSSPRKVAGPSMSTGSLVTSFELCRLHKFLRLLTSRNKHGVLQEAQHADISPAQHSRNLGSNEDARLCFRTCGSRDFCNCTCYIPAAVDQRCRRGFILCESSCQQQPSHQRQQCRMSFLSPLSLTNAEDIFRILPVMLALHQALVSAL